MKKTFLLLACLMSFGVSFAGPPAAPADSLNALIRPFLDSLRVDPSPKDTRSLRLVSIFPAWRAVDPRMDDFSDAGILQPFTPENGNLTGRVTGPVDVFGGCRIALEYALFNGDPPRRDDAMTLDYTFTSRVETAEDGQRMIRQILELTARPGNEVSGGFVEAVIWGTRTDGPVSIGRPVYRHILIYRGHRRDNHATHLIRDADGVYSPIDFTEGSDRTFASFKGGRTGEFVYMIRNMRFPEQALKDNLRATVHVTLTVTAAGKVKDIGFLMEPDPVFREEALRLARETAGKWVPATRNGINVDDQAVMDIPFFPEYAPQW